MPNYATPLLEFSPDPLSDTTPTYTDVTSYLKDAQWFSGIQRDLDPPQAGGATFVLRNKNRDWEPEYAGGRFAGNILPLRRFRWSINGSAEGTYYATSYQVVYPDPGSTESDVVVTCVDGVGLLALQGTSNLNPPTAASYSDVVEADSPFAHWPLTEKIGRTMDATTGPAGVYRKDITTGSTNAVVGEDSGGIVFGLDGFGKALLDDPAVFHDAGAVSAECVILKTGNPSTTRNLIAGPFDTAASKYSFRLSFTATEVDASVVNNGAADTTVASVTNLSNSNHHLALTFDGGTLTLYIDGVQSGQAFGIDNIVNPDAGEAIYIGNWGGTTTSTDTPPITISHVAVYTYALTAAQIANHATAALSRGYPSTTAGSRIATLATNALWSTAGIPAGTVTVAPRMQTGQKLFDEIGTTVACEQPAGIFFFNDAGNPDYVAWEDTTTIQATFGELEVQYDYPGLVYDDQVFNQSTASGSSGNAQTANDTTSQGQYGVRTQDEIDLIILYDRDAAMISQAVVDKYGNPQYRFESVDLNGASSNRLTQILAREIGDYIRIKRRGAGGTANPDIVTRIIGKSKHLDVARNLTCSWSLARGFSAATQVWHLSQSSYAELNTATILA